jgi:hypothetical protein
MIIIGGVYVGGCMFIKGGCTCIMALKVGDRVLLVLTVYPLPG